MCGQVQPPHVQHRRSPEWAGPAGVPAALCCWSEPGNWAPAIRAECLDWQLMWMAHGQLRPYQLQISMRRGEQLHIVVCAKGHSKPRSRAVRKTLPHAGKVSKLSQDTDAGGHVWRRIWSSCALDTVLWTQHTAIPSGAALRPRAMSAQLLCGAEQATAPPTPPLSCCIGAWSSVELGICCCRTV